VPEVILVTRITTTVIFDMVILSVVEIVRLLRFPGCALLLIFVEHAFGG